MPNVAERCVLSAGDRIGSHYIIRKAIGNGSFGTVYAASDDRGKKVAIKLLRLWDVHPDIRDGLVRRFDMEFETGRISSPYLVHSLDHGLIKGNPYIVMEFCSSGDVQQLFSKGNLNIETVATHTLLGLRELHRHGKVHRDLKPENVLLKDDGNFALTDFGISGDRNKRMTEMNIIGRPRQLFGTYAYMPPEQLNPRKDATVLPTTDIFSFGVMIYQFLDNGELPFGLLRNDGELVPYIRRGKAGDWSRDTIEKNGHKEWLPLLEGCLQPNYQLRLSSCDDVLALVPHYNRSDWNISDSLSSKRIVNGVLLRVMQGENYGESYPLDDMLKGTCAILTMGRRDPTVRNDIEIPETQSCYISRRHCTFELDYQRGCWVVRDGQWITGTTNEKPHWKPSSNGTYVNSQPVGPEGVPFEPGDIISLGEVTLRAEAY